MKSSKKFLRVLLAIVALFFLFTIWYKYTYSMDTAETVEVNASDMPAKLLVATQGSDYKNSVTQGVIDYYKSDSVFIKVIDVSDLPNVNSESYDAILVMHTWEYEKPPAEVESFMEKMKRHKDKIVVMTTSGPGTSKMEGIDAITGESKLGEAPRIVAKIIERMNPLLK